MIPLNYHQLYYFWTIAKHGSIKKGSEKLLLTVSTLSTQLTQLERSMKMKLLKRSREGVSLTAEGWMVFERCERIFSEGELLADVVTKKDINTPTILRLGVQNSIASWIVAEIFSFIDGLGQNIRLGVHGGSHRDIQERLRNHALDIVLTNLNYSINMGHDFDNHLLAKIPLTFVGTRKLQAKIKKFPSGLEGIPLILPTEENPIRRRIDNFLNSHKVTPSIVAEVENPMLIRRLARESVGIAVVDTATISRDIKDGRLIRLHNQPLGIHEHIWLLYCSGRQASQKLATAIQTVAKKFLPSFKELF